ncbi:glutathione S-transferase C-terminal domain-containing protein [Chiloscyllium plagiosum]|uniref:glutathione S-transferase C-terminal domain-containing protein n=1 Tax=Chiloscyllium plagiosum TaxID=36176 RepID=UPI001CB81FAB|nr:glutathione S-transferase C-terminal domain-containing protein [Chiloscyllium plagiosum]XP_043530282.1 glutathione S-transferase C-terminal domain-containing protein [Chiloscyllium plagiosum]XP_043530283.1 glutathione S-transferase C-terminal domain-containing protein [Chiloscyllium plagiosum]
MKNKSIHEACLYLELSNHAEDKILPLHTSIVLFLMSYCESTSINVFMVPNEDSASNLLWRKGVPANIPINILSQQELPPVVKSCRLPALVEKDGNFCRAGLAVVLRHIIWRTCETDCNRKDVSELLGFKKTCLKACAEVSQWTRLCEISIPLAVEGFVKDLSDQRVTIPPEILHLELKLGEPVRIHNDDKIRRQKLQLLSKESNKEFIESGSERSLGCFSDGRADAPGGRKKENRDTDMDSLELKTALSKLTVEQVPAVTNREQSCIRKVKTTDLPPLEHIFAEGLYFTLTDMVLLPCLHYFFVSLGDCRDETLKTLPLLARWYQRVQEVSGVKKAAASCDIHLLNLCAPSPSSAVAVSSSCEPKNDKDETTDFHFRGGPRPTMNKLEENGISANFTSHPYPSWSLDWGNLPVAVNPIEGSLSSERALRKQQQLDNIISIVTKQANPGDTIVDFCSGGGHVGIVLAHTLPLCQVILVENKEESLIRAKDRCDDLKLNNIWFIQANLDYFTGPFEIGVALHACGVATDMVIDHCKKAQAAFVISPCCYGFIQNTVKFSFPRSQKFRSILSYKEHMILCRFADQTAVHLPPERKIIGKKCMGLVDLDRACSAEESGYTAYVSSMEPNSCSPKNNLIVGSLSSRHLNLIA